MKLRHLTHEIKQLGTGLVGETLNFLVIGLMPDEPITYEQENMLPHSYTLLGLGKILHNKSLVNEARNLRRKSRNYSNQKIQFYKDIQGGIL